MASSAQLQLMVATITHCSVAAGVTAAAAAAAAAAGGGAGAGDERVNDAATGASTNHAAAPT